MTTLAHVRWRAVIALVVGLTILLTFGPMEAAGAEKKGRKVRYPPARLWYRVSVDFTGEGSPRLTDQLPFSRFNSAWTLESNTAIRLTLLCVDQLDIEGDAEPYFIRRKIGGRRTRVGGCPKPAPKDHGPAVGFAANATGEVTSWEHRAIRSTEDCGEYEFGSDLVSSQPLGGWISTPSSLSEGVSLGAGPVHPLGTQRYFVGAHECTFGSDPGYEFDTPFDSTNSFFGNEPAFAEANSTSGWVLLSTYLSFHFPAGRFGRDFTVSRTVSQPELLSDYPPPPVGGDYAPTLAKEYTYTIRFEACPDRGRDVENC